jgi:uncharacterized protein YeeX (DUF496 family)
MKKSSVLNDFLVDNFPDDFKELQMKRSSLLSFQKTLFKLKHEIQKKTAEQIREGEYAQSEENIAQLKILEDYLQKLEAVLELLEYPRDFAFDDFKLDNLAEVIEEMQPHYINENFSGKNPAAFRLKKELFKTENWRGLLLKTCHLLINLDKDKFKEFIKHHDFKNSSQYYFSRTDSQVNSSAALNLNDQIIYIYMNFNTSNISNLISELLKKYEISSDDFEIYLEEDYKKKRERAFSAAFFSLP